MASASFHFYVVFIEIVIYGMISSSSIDTVALSLKAGMRVRAMGVQKEKKEAEEWP